MRLVLRLDEEYPFLTQAARERLAAIRLQWRDLVQDGALCMRRSGQEWELYTFAGDRINLLLGRALAMLLGCRIDGDSFSVSVKPSEGQAPIREHDLWQALEAIHQPDFFSTERVLSMVQSLPRGRLSKFQPLLPPDLEARFLAERLFDVEGLQNWLTDVLNTRQVG
jgi:ATP-dependent Lhr-like helicase